MLPAEMVTAGATMVTHGNCLYVFGGMDDERQEQLRLWRWNLNSEEGFEAVTYRCSSQSVAVMMAAAMPVQQLQCNTDVCA